MKTPDKSTAAPQSPCESDDAQAQSTDPHTDASALTLAQTFDVVRRIQPHHHEAAPPLEQEPAPSSE